MFQNNSSKLFDHYYRYVTTNMGFKIVVCFSFVWKLEKNVLCVVQVCYNTKRCLVQFK